MFRPRGASAEFRVTDFVAGLPRALVGVSGPEVDAARLMPLVHDTATAGSPAAGGRGSCKGKGGQGGAAGGDGAGGARVADGGVITVVGCGIDEERRWRHAGGPEDWQVRREWWAGFSTWKCCLNKHGTNDRA